MACLCTVVGGEFDVDASALEGFEVDTHGSPVFPEDGVGVVMVHVPVQLVGGDEVGGVASGVEGVVVFVGDGELETGLGLRVVAGILKHGGIAQEHDVGRGGVDDVFV